MSAHDLRVSPPRGGFCPVCRDGRGETACPLCLAEWHAECHEAGGCPACGQRTKAEAHALVAAELRSLARVGRLLVRRLLVRAGQAPDAEWAWLRRAKLEEIVARVAAGADAEEELDCLFWKSASRGWPTKSDRNGRPLGLARLECLEALDSRPDWLRPTWFDDVQAEGDVLVWVHPAGDGRTFVYRARDWEAGVAASHLAGLRARLARDEDPEVAAYEALWRYLQSKELKPHQVACDEELLAEAKALGVCEGRFDWDAHVGMTTPAEEVATARAEGSTLAEHAAALEADLAANWEFRFGWPPEELEEGILEALEEVAL